MGIKGDEAEISKEDERLDKTLIRLDEEMANITAMISKSVFFLLNNRNKIQIVLFVYQI